MIELITSALTVVGKWLGLITQRDAERNAADVKAAAAARDEQKAQAGTKEAIADGDLQREREEVSE